MHSDLDLSLRHHIQHLQAHIQCSGIGQHKYEQPGKSATLVQQNIRSAMSATAHRPTRLTLLDQTFWEVLPAHYHNIKQRWVKIATLHSSAQCDLRPSDRARAVEPLKAELEMLEKDISEYRNIVRGIDITDVAEMYVVAGKARQRALQIAKEDFEDVEASLKGVEDKMLEIRDELVY